MTVFIEDFCLYLSGLDLNLELTVVSFFSGELIKFFFVNRKET